MDELTSDVIERAWDITPTTIYGFLIVVLVIAVIVLFIRLQKLTNKFIDVLPATSGALNDISSSIDAISQQQNSDTQRIIDNINSLKK